MFKALILSLALGQGAWAAQSDFLGQWKNPASDGGVSRILLAAPGGNLRMAVFGQCSGGECPWGKEDAQLYSSSVSVPEVSGGVAVTALFETGFSETLVTLEKVRGGLAGATYTVFTDQSGRAAYRKKFFLKKIGVQRLPDLVVVQVTRPVVSQGQSTFRAQIRNVGTAAAGASIARVMDESTLQSTGAPQNAIAHVGPLGAGQSQWVSMTLPYNVFNPRAELDVTADYKGMVTESRENNNTRSWNGF